MERGREMRWEGVRIRRLVDSSCGKEAGQKKGEPAVGWKSGGRGVKVGNEAKRQRVSVGDSIASH